MHTVQKILVAAVVGIDEEKTLSLVRHGLAKGIDPFCLLEDTRSGLELVGTMYNEGKYFLADLIMASEIYQQVQEIVLGKFDPEVCEENPQVIFGTVEKDIHDIGKNIAIATLRYAGIRVRDMGVNVTPEILVQNALSSGAFILCLSGLISDAYDSMKKTVTLLKSQPGGADITVIIGGLVNEQVCAYTGADYWVKNCSAGATLCQRLIKEKTANTCQHSDNKR